MKAVEVTWLDSVILDQGEWIDLSNAQDSLTVGALQHRSVGYLAAESEHAILLAAGRNDQDDQANVRIMGGVVIPRVAVLNFITLRPVDVGEESG